MYKDKIAQAEDLSIMESHLTGQYINDMYIIGSKIGSGNQGIVFDLSLWDLTEKEKLKLKINK
jgi:hypothetical protein